MPTTLEVWNQALDAAGKTGNIPGTAGAPDPEYSSRESELCERWYPEVISVIQEAAWWGTSRAVLLLEDQVEEEDEEFNYSYGLPDDFLRARYLRSGYPFMITERFLTDDPEPKLVYSRENLDPETWPPAQSRATVFALASKLARPLTGHMDLARTLEAQANYYLLEARSIEGNKQPNQFDSIPDWITARQGSAVQQRTRYFYPFGALFHSYAPLDHENIGAETYPRAPIFG